MKKIWNSHIFTLKNLQYFPRFPKAPKVVLFGSPNVETKMFAHRLAMDIGVPAVSLRNIYKTILLNQEKYSNDLFYRKVIALLKSEDIQQSQRELNSDLIPEKLLTLTKHTESGFVLYDYPNSVTEAENLETLNGGISIFVNLLLNKELSLKREIGKYECQDCGREYNKSDLSYKHNNISWPAYFPENGFCDDCGSQNINFIGNENNFEEQYRQYEEKSREILPFYQELGLLTNFEVKNGLRDYEVLRQRVQYNIKH